LIIVHVKIAATTPIRHPRGNQEHIKRSFEQKCKFFFALRNQIYIVGSFS
jgi:hypothetical protein